MSRIVTIFAFFAFGCAASPAPVAPQPSGGTPAPNSSAPGASTASDPGDDPVPGATAGSEECPAPTEPCMNEDNHAECMAVAASCEGHVTQLESCPLQFACDAPP